MPATGKLTCPSRALAPLAIAAGLVLLGGCFEADDESAIERRTVTEPQPDHVPGQPSAVRFGFTSSGMGGASPHGSGFDPMASSGGGGGGGGLQLAYDTPEGWEEIPAGQFTLVRFRIGGRDDATCTLSSAGGGLVPNLNRWRGQMGLAPLGESEVAALPRIEMLGGEALLVEMTGTLQGKPDTTMLGALVQHEGTGVFAKLTAPASVAVAERERFIAMCASMTDGHDHGTSSSAPANPHAAVGSAAATQPAATAGGAAPSSGRFAAGTLSWSTPEGWTAGKGSSFRLATLVPPGATAAELVITPLQGEAGGVEANLNLWRSQVGLGPLSAEELAGLPTVEVLGAPCKYIEVEGILPARDGSGPQTMRLVGLVASVADHSIFVKMTGPVEEVDASRGGFMQVAESLSFQP